VNVENAFYIMTEQMIKEFSVTNGENEQETNLEGHNIVELTTRQNEVETKKKKCCKN